MSNSKPQLGDRVKDKVTGFTGIIVSHAKHLAGCDRMYLEPAVGEDNKTPDGRWVDIDMLDIVEAGAVKPVDYNTQPTTPPGGFDLPRSR